MHDSVKAAPHKVRRLPAFAFPEGLRVGNNFKLAHLYYYSSTVALPGEHLSGSMAINVPVLRARTSPLALLISAVLICRRPSTLCSWASDSERLAQRHGL